MEIWQCPIFSWHFLINNVEDIVVFLGTLKLSHKIFLNSLDCKKSQRLDLWFYLTNGFTIFCRPRHIHFKNSLFGLSLKEAIGKIRLDFCKRLCKSWFVVYWIKSMVSNRNCVQLFSYCAEWCGNARNCTELRGNYKDRNCAQVNNKSVKFW